MNKAKITIHPEYRIGKIDPRLFGAFLEPIGSMVNGSMYNPKHPQADELGLRRDFYGALRQAHLPTVRLPGGNYVSGWNWKDSIGEKSLRKTHLDLAWRQFITNEVGHDEYLTWAERAGADVIYTVNLGTGTVQDAADCVEYTNFPGGTYFSDLRAKNGHPAPYNVKTWCLGNEMDGPWQIASWEKDPRGYGILAHEASKAMKWVDPRIETVACVSSSPHLFHYPEWDRQALQECYETVDYISLHHYHSVPPDRPDALLAGYMVYEEYLRTEIALCDYVAALLRSDKTMYLSLDEYGSFFRPVGETHRGLGGRQSATQFYSFDPNQKYVRHDPDDWSTRRMPSSDGEMLRALGTASTMLVMLRHADRVRIGCATGGLGDLCRTDREHVWKGAAYYPFTQMISLARGVSLNCAVDCVKRDLPGYAIDDCNQRQSFEGAEMIQAAAALDEENGNLTVFAINADDRENQLLTVDARAFNGWTFKEHIEMYAARDKSNTYEDPNAILPAVNTGAKCENGTLTTVLKSASWNVLRFTRQ